MSLYCSYLQLFTSSLFSCRFASFYETAKADSTLQYLIAFLVLLSTIKMWHLLRLNPKMNMITATLQRAWSDISGFLLIILIMFLAYSITVNISAFFLTKTIEQPWLKKLHFCFVFSLKYKLRSSPVSPGVVVQLRKVNTF